MTHSPDLDTILQHFRALNRVPRRSKHERAAARFIADWAERQGLAWRQDAALNTVVEVPPTGGMDAAPRFIVQAHLDMVCVKMPDSAHDFSTDPIEVLESDGWLHARETTLGADNGIAVAMMMALAERVDLPHPALELLFTTDEETGLNGAAALMPDFLSGRCLINLDSETEGTITIGCAGGQDTHHVLDIERERDATDGVAVRLAVTGCASGHSGVDIHIGRANAIKMLTRALLPMIEAGARLASIEGGTAHNAIPANAHATLLFAGEAELRSTRERLTADSARLAGEYGATDPHLRIELTIMDRAESAPLIRADALRLLGLLGDLPHGIVAMSARLDGLVETSINMAIVRVEAARAEMVTSQRSSDTAAMAELSAQVKALGTRHGARVSTSDGYPAWSPEPDSPLLALVSRVHEQVLGVAPRILSIHAGLECGVIGERYPGMRMVSFGPNLIDPHTVRERVQVESIGRTWRLLTAVLAEAGKLEC